MVGGDDGGDDMAVELSWPDAQAPARRPAPAAGPLPATTRAAVDAAQEDGPSRPSRSDAVGAAQVLSAVQRVGSDVTALGRAHKRELSRAVQELSDRLTSFEQAGADPNMAGALHKLGERLTSIEAAVTHADDDVRFDAFVDVLASISHRQDELAAAMAVVVDRLSDRSELAAILEWAEHRDQLLADRLESIDARLPRRSAAQSAPAGGSAVEDTLFAVLEHLTTLSSLVTGTSRASSAELDALQRRIAQTQVSVDDVRATVHEELAVRPLLSDVDVRRIADAVTESLLENVRVEADEGEAGAQPPASGWRR